MLTALHDPSLSQQAAIFRQHQQLRENSVITNAMCGTAMKSVRAQLQDSSTVRLLVSVTLLLLTVCFCICKDEILHVCVILSLKQHVQIAVA